SADINEIMTGRLKRYAELPHLIVDGSGTLCMVFRHWTDTKPNETYHFYTTRLSGNTWTLPSKLALSSGHNSQHASLTLNPAGELFAAYSSDGRGPTTVPTDQAHSLHYNVYLSALSKGSGPPTVAFQDATLPEPMTHPP